MTDWFPRAVLRVANAETALEFYVSRLGFTVPWNVEWDGRRRIAQLLR